MYLNLISIPIQENFESFKKMKLCKFYKVKNFIISVKYNIKTKWSLIILFVTGFKVFVGKKFFFNYKNFKNVENHLKSVVL